MGEAESPSEVFQLIANGRFSDLRSTCEAQHVATMWSRVAGVGAVAELLRLHGGLDVKIL